jgi:hypothetical protein
VNAALLMLIALLGAHWYFDYAGQGDFMAKAKDPANPLPGVPWRQVLIAHAGIHGAAVALITGIWWLGVLEFAAHAITDKAKCERQITYTQDQAVHLCCKVLWWLVALVMA